MNTYLIAIDAMGNGNLSNILPGLYSVNGFLVGPNGEQIACKTTRFNIAAVSNSYIDLSLKQELVNSNGVSYKYRITVKNDGNALASNFTVKDYLPTNSSFSFSSDGGVYNNTNHTVTWFVADLPA